MNTASFRRIQYRTFEEPTVEKTLLIDIWIPPKLLARDMDTLIEALWGVNRTGQSLQQQQDQKLRVSIEQIQD